MTTLRCFICDKEANLDADLLTATGLAPALPVGWEFDDRKRPRCPRHRERDGDKRPALATIGEIMAAKIRSPAPRP